MIDNTGTLDKGIVLITFGAVSAFICRNTGGWQLDTDWVSQIITRKTLNASSWFLVSFTFILNLCTDSIRNKKSLATKCTDSALKSETNRTLQSVLINNSFCACWCDNLLGWWWVVWHSWFYCFRRRSLTIGPSIDKPTLTGNTSRSNL